MVVSVGIGFFTLSKFKKKDLLSASTCPDPIVKFELSEVACEPVTEGVDKILSSLLSVFFVGIRFPPFQFYIYL